MKSVRDAIVADCETLREDLTNSDGDLAALAHDRARLVRARRTGYVAGIVQLYGLLEQATDQVLIATANAYNSIHPSVDTMPTRVQQEFRRLSLQSLIDGARSRLREEVDESTLLQAINTASEPAVRKLMPPVFTHAQANYRGPQIRDLLGRLDVPVGQKEPGDARAMLDRLGKSSIESVIHDLVERRNGLAHAYSFQDEILGPDVMAIMLDVVEKYLLHVEDLVNERMLKEAADSGACEALGVVAHRWTHKIGVDLERGTIAVGDSLLLRRKNGTHLFRVVTSLMTGKAEVQSVDASALGDAGYLEVGIGLAPKAPPQLVGAAVVGLPAHLQDLLPPSR
jgi:hypothetical protein